MGYFRWRDMDSPDEPGSGFMKMKRPFTEKLHNLAIHTGWEKIVITSGYRSEEHNKKVGGVPTSSHLKGWAADISAPGSRDRYLIVQAAIKAGLNRIGIGSNFIHVDADPEKASNVIWLY